MRDHREGLATLFVDQPLAEGDTVSLDSCADHIRARRLRADEPIALTNGKGTIAHGSLSGSDRAGWTLRVASRKSVARINAPRLFAPVADRTRLLWLAEKAIELGLESWCLVEYHRSASVAPRGEGTAFRDKVRDRMIAALEQSRGAWLPELQPDVAVPALSQESSRHRLVLHQSGQPLIPTLQGVAGGCSIALGPEGGFEDRELEMLVSSGWTPVSLGPGILRFETAGVAALAIVRALLQVTED